MPCMRSCSGVKVSCPGVRGAEGPGKRQGALVRERLQAAWNEGAGRGTRTGYAVWYARDEWARHPKVRHPQLGRAVYIRRLGPDGMTADRGRSAGCPRHGLRAEASSLTAPPTSAEGIGGPAQARLVSHPKAARRGNREAEPPRERAEGLNGREESRPGVERREGIRRAVGLCLASGMNARLARREKNAPVGVMSHPDSICRTAGYVTHLSGGVGGGRP